MKTPRIALVVLALASLTGCKKKPAAPPPPAAPVRGTAVTSTPDAGRGSTTTAQTPTTPEAADAEAPAPATNGAGNGAGSGPAFVLKSHALPPPSTPVSEFKPSTSGFKFQNYGNSENPTNLTSTELRRMFGDQVCASLEGGNCILTPAAQQWMEASNSSMGGGHCEGFAALALLMERGQIDPKLFGANSVPELDIAGNEKLQREIAYWFVTQGVMPMAAAEDKTLTPNEVVAKLKESFAGGAETYTLGIYNPGYRMGHATTPYAVVDKGENIVWIMHYDNNYPGEEKHVEVNTEENTWTYTTAADPAASEHDYKGDAETKTLTIAPTSVRTGPLVCHFCGDVGGGQPSAKKGNTSEAAPTRGGMQEIILEGDANLLITDADGKRLGYVDGALVNEIPGALFSADKSEDKDEAKADEPVYYIPSGRALKVTLDGEGLDHETLSDVNLIGHGYTLAVEGVSVSADQKDEIEFSEDGSKITYTTKGAETPTLLVGIATTGADYEFEVKVSGETEGQKVELSIDVAKGTVSVKVDGNDAGGASFSVKLTRIDQKGAQEYHHEGMTSEDAQTVQFAYGAWKGDKAPLHVSVLGPDGAAVKEADEADAE